MHAVEVHWNGCKKLFKFHAVKWCLLLFLAVVGSCGCCRKFLLLDTVVVGGCNLIQNSAANFGSY